MAAIIHDLDDFMQNCRPFFSYLKDWSGTLQDVRMEDIIEDASGAESVTIVSVDVIEGFTRKGPLASPRIEKIIDPIVRLFNRANELGITNIILSQDTHSNNNPQFKSYLPHSLAGTEESLAVREIRELPFYDKMKIIPKNSVLPSVDTDLQETILSMNPKRVIVVGDCTDICAYLLSMFIRCLANSRELDWEVIVPVNAVDTYDLPVNTSLKSGTTPHPAALLHAVFLYHMNLNGIRIVNKIF